MIISKGVAFRRRILFLNQDVFLRRPGNRRKRTANLLNTGRHLGLIRCDHNRFSKPGDFSDYLRRRLRTNTCRVEQVSVQIQNREADGCSRVDSDDYIRGLFGQRNIAYRIPAFRDDMHLNVPGLHAGNRHLVSRRTDRDNRAALTAECPPGFHGVGKTGLRKLRLNFSGAGFYAAVDFSDIPVLTPAAAAKRPAPRDSNGRDPFKRKNLVAAPKRGNQSRRTGFLCRIGFVKFEIIPGGNNRQRLHFNTVPGHLHESGLRRHGGKEGIEVSLGRCDLLHRINR